ncbi:hypothetical protein GCM10007216_07240 [Thalassobacillus devorans]|uniref:Uncharacterized protein n=1 Tax=Thalassobacillus devorans TaxID=279813 RepID=A0ABQ1NMU7_9BACI|nr:hypothetical protein [Thalassobacillus devorans]NIK27635.1 uncharacterized protein YjeT (DUF2065 family) [Thalassobacillus devorans]GGC79310.1 hypothetical protein GCM10007216_07240 [Thalassobacillus devorans]
MKKLWTKLEEISGDPKLRIPLYLAAIVFGVGMYFHEDIFKPTLFIIILGLLLISECIYPYGIPYAYSKVMPSLLKKPVFFGFRVIGIVLGAFLAYIGGAVEIGWLIREIF